MLEIGLLNAFLVELQCLSDVVEDPQVVHNQTVALLFAVGPIGPADGLEKRVVAQRLVEVHRLKDGRIEPCQQLRRDDDDLQWVLRIAEPVKQLLLGIPITLVGGVVGFTGCSRA